MAKLHLNAEEEREAKILEAKIGSAVDGEISDMARLLVSKSEEDTFGLSEFQIRELVLHLGVLAFQEHLRGKKTASAASR
jgi:hypothetical protein